MPTLYLIDGTGGAGKSNFLEYCTKKNPAYNSLIIKYTTKPITKFEKGKEDLCYCSIEEYESIKLQGNTFYEYQFPSTSNTNYLILKSDIDAALRKYRNVYLVVRSVDVITQIQRDYKQYYNVNVKTLFLYCEEEITRDRMTKQLLADGLSLSEIQPIVQKRIDSNQDCLYQYMASFDRHVYDHLILNSVDEESYKRSLNVLLNMYDKFDDNFTPLHAFIIMPFMEGRQWLHFHEVCSAIIKGAKQQGIIAVRQDSIVQTNSSEIIHGIKKSIENNYLFIVDLTSSRQNCYYELGLAEQSGKNPSIILMKEKNEQLPFDLQGRFCHEYSFHGTHYENISNLVSAQLQNFIDEHIFLTEALEKKRNEIKAN